jgi:hypothetical protein
LNPIGIDSPLAICRCVGLSVVRAPMLASATRSAMYCGVIGSSISVATGRPNSLICSSTRRASRSPPSMSKLSSRCGSLISPFQPTVVRGFSK